MIMKQNDWTYYLPYGYTSLLASKHGVSPSLVSMVIKGHRKNNKILDDAISMAENEKKRRRIAQDEEEARRERIAKLTA